MTEAMTVTRDGRVRATPWANPRLSTAAPTTPAGALLQGREVLKIKAAAAAAMTVTTTTTVVAEDGMATPVEPEVAIAEALIVAEERGHVAAAMVLRARLEGAVDRKQNRSIVAKLQSAKVLSAKTADAVAQRGAEEADMKGNDENFVLL